MKKSVIRPFFALILISAFSAAIFAQTAPPSGSPVEKHGQLKVVGNQVLDKNDEPVQLRGMSFFWDCWAASFYNANVVNTLVDDWEATLVRAAFGGAGNERNCVGGNKTATTTVIDAAIAKGIYVIIDWHSHYADQEQSQAISFFQEMATAYKDYPNVIYEIFNEPTNQAWATVIKPYSQALVNAIRAVDPNNLILIGTRQWCQRPDEAAADSVAGKNLAYVMHFYAATHKNDLRNNTFRALRLNKAIFVSEFGTVLSSGGGAFDQANSDIWMDFMDQFGLSWANWSIFNKDEAASALTPTSGATGGWGTNNFTASGAYIRNRLKTPPSTEQSFYTLTVDVEGSGNVYQGTTGTTNPNQVFYKGTKDTALTLRAAAAQGDWTFTGWQVNGENKGNEAAIQVTVGGSADVAVTATFYSPTSTLPTISRNKTAPWSIKMVSGGIVLRGPVSGPAEIAFYDMRGKQVGKFLRSAGANGQSITINNFKVPAGNYIMAVKDRVSNKEVYRTKISLVK
jgi:endoglucanase